MKTFLWLLLLAAISFIFMDITTVCIATITLARTDEEENMLQQSLAQLAALNLPVYIADGGSQPSFIQFLKTFTNFHVLPQTRKGVCQQALYSLQAAADARHPFIFYTEPDKKDFFSHGLPQLLAGIQPSEATGIVMASRSAGAFGSFASFQQMTETTINNCCAEMLGKPGDYTYGPFLLNKKLVPFLLQLKEDVGWGWRPYLFHMAHRAGYQIDSISGNYHCPPGQEQDTPAERLYRIKQLHQNLQGLLLSTTATL